MKNLLQMMGISIILWFGLGIGLANAATSISTTNDNETDATLGHNISVGMVGIDGAPEMSGSGLAVLDVNVSAVNLLNSANTIAATGTTSNPSSFSDVTESPSTDTTSLQASGPMSKISGYVADAKNSPHVPTHQTFAMLLVGLGLLGLSARHRTNAI